ncbi:putative ABC transport system permease protein [Runella defluvii]|uniref:Putative ABC transport system permease protein n=1 Tax=Runella defluvii TaxID=370973 RepID=A0A7W6ES19_9BACT|nr:ABC transporter permease [Runella defluvii]MBB3840284.1 putative ABC transport system permease protein [Runella defluvii]
MLRNYLKIAWRNLLKNKLYSIINIFGLAIGLTCFLLISLYVVDELSYDRYLKDAARIYRIHSDIKFGGTEMKMALSSDPFGPTLKKDYPEVEQYVRLFAQNSRRFIRKGNEFLVENNCVNADSTFFEVFPLHVLEGDGKTALNAPNTVAISKSVAKKYFGDGPAVGKILSTGVNNPQEYKVTAVYEDIPQNSHLRTNIIFSFKNVDYTFGNFLSHNFYTYVKLKEGVDYKQFEKKFDGFINKYILPQAKAFIDIKSMDEFKKAGNYIQYSLMPLLDIHLKSNKLYEFGVNGNIEYVYIFSIVALFLLLIACINFMNLSTARSANRAKEVGIRKVLGTERNSLIRQFMAESILTSYLAFGIALVFTTALLPYFNQIAGKEFTPTTIYQPAYLPFLLALPLGVGALAGYYPSFFLSSFKPIEVLKSKLNANFKRSNFRNALVTFQFVTSLVLVISTFIIYRQLNYIQHKNLGFSKDQVLVVTGTSSLGENNRVFKEEVKKMAGVKAGAFAGYLPVANSSRSDNTYSKTAVIDVKNGFNMQNWVIDEEYIPTLGMEIIKGRNFSKAFGADSSSIIINEETAKMLGYDDPVGKNLYAGTGNASETSTLTIIGVVKNFHYSSMRENVGPLCFRYGRSGWDMAFKINTSESQQLVKQIEGKWKQLSTGMPFNYHFLDDSFNEMYQAEQRVGTIALIFAILTIFIACLGLFGLITYIAEQRTKEIGVRKVLGASLWSIVGLLSKDFLKLVGIAFLIAAPLAYYAMNTWLEDFAFRVEIPWWIFVAAGVATMLLAFLTVSFQSIKAALMNPVKSLKSE